MAAHKSGDKVVVSGNSQVTILQRPQAERVLQDMGLSLSVLMALALSRITE